MEEGETRLVKRDDNEVKVAKVILPLTYGLLIYYAGRVQRYA